MADDATPASGHSMDMGSTPEASPETTPVPPPWQPVTGEELTEPEVRQSVDGVLETTLEAKTREVTVAGTKVTSIGYEGQFSGPTLRMNQADPVFVVDSTSGFACHAEASAKAGHSSFWEQLCSQA